MRALLRTVAINFAVLASLLVLIAIGLEIYLRATDGRMSGIDRRRGELENYAGAEWPKTHWREINQLRTVYFSFVEWRRDLFQGETVNIVGPYRERATAVAADAKGGEVFFFGGSTMWGTGARDAETIPSYYSAITGRPARNFGESGYVAHQDLEMMLWLLQSGERPAAVVFYDGVNDVAHRCRKGFGGFSHIQESRMRAKLVRESGLFDRTWQILVQRFAPGGGGDDDDDDPFDCDNDPAKAQRVADAMIDDWWLARQAAERKGVAFFAFLQPVVYFSDTIDDKRADFGRSTDDGRRKQFEAVYPLLRARLAEVGAIDLTAALDAQELFYIDFCHLSPNGNERVAAALALAIEPSLAGR